MASLTQNGTDEPPFSWDEASVRATELLAEDKLSDATIAKRCGISRSTLSRWKLHPEFKARITDLTDELFERARRRGIARLDRRMVAYEDRHKRMSQLMRARARDMQGEVAGGGTGLLVRTPKRVQVSVTTAEVQRDGEITEETTTHTEERYEYAFDAALMREMRELEKQVAQDTGQWLERRELSGSDGGPIVIREIEVPLPARDDE